MALVFADRVKVRSNFTGTGSAELQETVFGHRGFDAVGDGNETYYGIIDNNGNWEIGRGTYSAPSTLSRDSILSSSNNNEIVDFPNGSKNIFVTFPASLAGDISGSVASDSFKTISVAGQSNVVADSSTDTLTLVAGTNITITTDNTTDTITINSTASGSGSYDQDLNTTNEVTFAGVNADGSVSLLGPEGLHNVILTNSGIAGPGLRITIPEAGLGTSHDFYIDASQGIPMIQFPDGYFQTTAFKGSWTELNGQLYAEAATDSLGNTVGGQYNLSSMTEIDFGPDEVNISLFDIQVQAAGTITASELASSTYSITLTSGTVSTTMTAWAVSPTDISTFWGNGTRFHYLGELVTDNGDGTYLFDTVVLDAEVFPEGTEIRFFEPEGTLRTPIEPLELVWTVGETTAVTGVIVPGSQIYNSQPSLIFVVGADVTANEFPVLIQTVGYTDSYATHELDPDKGFRLRSENSDFFIEADNGKPIVVQTGGNQWIFSGDGSLTVPGPITSSDSALQLKKGDNDYIEFFTGAVNLGSSGDVSLSTLAGDPAYKQWVFKTDGSILYPDGATQSGQVYTFCPAGADTVIYTPTGQYQTALKLFVMVEGTTDETSSLETQACDIIAVRGLSGDNIVHVTAYGVTYSNTTAFATFDGRWNATTSRIEIVCRPTSTTNAVYAQVHAIEFQSGI